MPLIFIELYLSLPFIIMTFFKSFFQWLNCSYLNLCISLFFFCLILHPGPPEWGISKQGSCMVLSCQLGLSHNSASVSKKQEKSLRVMAISHLLPYILIVIHKKNTLCIMQEAVIPQYSRNPLNISMITIYYTNHSYTVNYIVSFREETLMGD